MNLLFYHFTLKKPHNIFGPKYYLLVFIQSPLLNEDQINITLEWIWLFSPLNGEILIALILK